MSRNKYVLACINGLKPSDAVIDYACWFANLLDKDLKLFHTIDEQYHETKSNLSGSLGVGTREQYLSEIVEIEHEQNKLLQKKSKLILEDAKNLAEQCGAKKIELCLRKGRLIENLTELEDKIALTVIGKFGKHHQNEDDKQSGVGHNVESIIKSFNKPVLVVSDYFEKSNSVVLAFNGSKESLHALDFIAANSGFKRLDIHIVYIGEPRSEVLSALDIANEKLSKLGYKFKIVKLSGEVITVLREYVDQNNISLMIMGAFGHNWLHDLVKGSLTSKIIKGCPRPILLLR